MSEPKTAREGFVEAMRNLWGGCDLKSIYDADFEAACDAFADAECEWTMHNSGPNRKADHESCRATLRAEVFGE